MNYQIKVFGRTIFYFIGVKGKWGWFRLFGVGVHWKNISKIPLLYSERNRLTNTLRFGKWSIRYLKYTPY